ncbi:MAG: hypothetical protein LBC74_13145, partial [Planctomycetaceae bacterium]|nr:hypothetical protein [Planctomycetaceae bacterium]
ESATFGLDGVNDQNEGDEHNISALEIHVTDTKIGTLNKDNNTATLDNGIIVTFDADANTVTIDSTKRNKLPVDGQPEKIEIIVTIIDDSGATCKSTWSTTITNKIPSIDNNFSHTYIRKTDDQTPYNIDLNDNITDQNIPNRNEDQEKWYKVSDLTIDNNTDNELITALDGTLKLNNDGILIFTPSTNLLNYLATHLREGEFIEIKLSYLVTDNILQDVDGNFVSARGELLLKIYGKTAAEVTIGDNNSINLENADTDGNIEFTKQITITDPDDNSDYLSAETEYKVEIDYSSVQIIGEQAEQFTQQFTQYTFNTLFTIDDKNNIKFTGNADMFQSLKLYEELEFNFDILVTDQYGTLTTEAASITIVGKGDPAIVISTTENLTIWGNKRNKNPESFNINFEIDDPDANETHKYSFEGLFDNDDVKIDLQNGAISIDETNGTVTLNESFFNSEFLQNLNNENSTFKIKINVAGNTDLLTTTIELEINIKFAQNPEVNDIVVQKISATDKIDNLQISVTDNNDDAPRNNENYTYTQPELAENNDLPNEIKDKITASIDIDTGIFSFDPNGIFDYLGINESVNLTFNFSVEDTIYNVSSTVSIIVTINGINEPPQFNDNSEPVNAEQITTDENNNGVKIDLANLFSDIDQNDKHKVVSINEVTLTSDWQTINGLGQFKYTNADQDGYGGELWYRAFVPEDTVDNQLEKLSAKLTTLEFDVVIEDNSGTNNNTVNGTLQINVTGINSQPIINKNKIDKPIEENSISNDYYAKDFVVDQNTDDAFTFDSINGTKILEPSNTNETQTIILNDETKIIVSANRKSFKIDTTSRCENLEPDTIVLNNILVTIKDNSQSENAISLPCSIQFKIKGINDKPKMNNQHFGVNPNEITSDSNGKYIGFIPITDVDTDTKEYSYTIEKNDNVPKFIVIQCNNGAAIYINEKDIPTLVTNESFNYTFTIIAHSGDETVTAQITVTFSQNEKPIVTFDDSDSELTITENKNEEYQIAEKEIIVTSNNGEEITGYTYTNVRFVEGKIKKSNNAESIIYSLPQGVEFGFNEDKFYLKSNGKFDFIGEDESVELTFEFTVFDNNNNIGTTETINVIIIGKNSAPIANNVKAEIDIPINDNTGYPFYLEDLFTDVDQNDLIEAIYVNGKTFNLINPNLDIYNDGINYGTVQFDSRNRCLIFVPNPDAPIRANETFLLKFQFNVTDEHGAKSNDGEITIRLRGVNKPPVFKDNVTLSVNENEQLTINAAQLATDTNDDPLRIIGVKVGNTTITAGESITLDSGAVLILTESGQLIYDPTKRTTNLNMNQSEIEKFSLQVADEYENGPSNTAWKEFCITVKGVNDVPVDIKPDNSEVIGNFKGEELLIKLSDYFNDPDNDNLSYEIETQLDENSFIESSEIKEEENGELYLAIKFKTNIYSDNLKFEPTELIVNVKDNNGGEITKTFAIKLPSTVKIDITTTENSDDSDDIYEVTVNATDLINELLGYNYSNGFTTIKFSINIDPEFYEVIDIDSIGTAQNYGYAIFVEITADQIAEMYDPLKLTLLTFKVKMKSPVNAQFSIGNYIEIFRNTNLIDESQIA